MSAIAQYTVVCCRKGSIEGTTEEVAAVVNQYICDGWQPFGSLVYDPKYEFMFQAMVLSQEIFEAQEKAEAEAQRASIKRELAKLRQIHDAPSESWLRKKIIYERHQAGETYTAMAEEMERSPSRIQQLSDEWKRLLSRMSKLEGKLDA